MKPSHVPSLQFARRCEPRAAAARVERAPETGDATDWTMPVREFPRQSMKINLISMLQQSDSSLFSALFREIFPKKPRSRLKSGHCVPLFGRNRRN